MIRAYPYVWPECDLNAVLRALPVLEDVLTAPDVDDVCSRIPHPFDAADLAALHAAGFDLQLRHLERHMTRKEMNRLGCTRDRLRYSVLCVSPGGRGFNQR